MSCGVGHHFGDLWSRVSQRAKAFRHGAVDDLEIAAAREFLEFDESEIRLDAGGIAIHHEADGAGRRDDAHLRVAIAMTLAERHRAIPRGAGMLAKRFVR